MPHINTNLAVEQHKSAQNAVIELYDIDATNLIAGSGSYFRFTPTATSDGQQVIWNGNIYQPFAIAAEGWTSSSSGALPRPKLQIGNVNKIIQNAVITLNDMVGARVIRRRIFEQFLDNGLSPDAGATFPIEDFIISRKVSHDKNLISFELISFLDREGEKIPKRQLLRKDFPGLATTRIRT